MAALRLFFIALAILLLPSLEASAQKNVPATIIATLPPYCKYKYIDGLKDDPQYSIKGCGVYINHFCGGLVKIAQARVAKSKSERSELLRMASDDMNYTLHWTADYPDCMARPIAEAKLKEIQQLRQQLR